MAEPANRPRTTPETTRPHKAMTSRDKSRPQTTEQLPELLEYEWPDLPPITTIRDAMSRTTISRGITYILPVDKGRNSIQNGFRTDMRAMFHKPYSNHSHDYDDNLVSVAAKKHFHMSSTNTIWSKRNADEIPVVLNSESEKYREIYLRSAPTGSRCLDPDRTRFKKRLSYRTKPLPSSDADKMRLEAERVIKSAQEMSTDPIDSQSHPKAPSRPTTVGTNNIALKHTNQSSARTQLTHGLTTNQITSYSEIKEKAANNRFIPEFLCSRFLSQTKNEAIWKWLHNGVYMSDFEYFLSVCG